MTSKVRALTVAEVREADRRAIEEFGIPGVVLMENAGRGAAGVALEMLVEAGAQSALILAGRGNNGGDGYVIARHLANAGIDVCVRVLSPLDDIAGDARTNLDIIRKMELDVREVKLPDGRDALGAEFKSAGTRFAPPSNWSTTPDAPCSPWTSPAASTATPARVPGPASSPAAPPPSPHPSSDC